MMNFIKSPIKCGWLSLEGNTLLATTISSGFPDEYFCTSFSQFSIFSNVDKFVTSKTRNMASVLIYSSFLTSMYSGLPERSHRCTLTLKIKKKLYNVKYIMYYTLIFKKKSFQISRTFPNRFIHNIFSCLFDVADVLNFLFQFAFFNSILIDYHFVHNSTKQG